MKQSTDYSDYTVSMRCSWIRTRGPEKFTAFWRSRANPDLRV